MADKCVKSKILHYFSFFSASVTKNISAQHNKKYFNLIWNACHLLVYSVEPQSTNIVYEFYAEILDVNSFKGFVFILLDNGTFVNLELPHPTNKSEKAETSNTCSEVSNKDIFTDLLANNEDIFTDLSSDSVKKQILWEDNSYKTVRIGENNGIVTIPDAVGFHISGNCICVLSCTQNNHYTLTGYNFTKLFGSVLERDSSSKPIAKDILWRICFETDQSMRNSKFTGFLKGIQRKIPTEHKPSILTCYSDTQTANDQAFLCHKSCILNATLFQSLFGSEIALLNCPVLLVSIPNSGTVYYIPTLPLPSKGGQNPAILYKFPQPILGVFPIKLQHGDIFETEAHLSVQSRLHRNPNTDSLLLLGSNGKLVLIYQVNTGLVQEFESIIPGPVYNGIVVHNTLVHSNLLDTFHTSFWLTTEGGIKRVESGLIGFHGATMVAGFGNKELSSPLQVLDLLMVTHSGRLYQIEADLRCGAAVARTNGGLQIKDLLTSLGNMSVELDKVHQRLSQQDRLIEQLNLASVIASGYATRNMQDHHGVIASGYTTRNLPVHQGVGYTARNCPEPQDSPLSIHYTVECRETGTDQIYTLVTGLKFSAKSVDISTDWYVTVKVSPSMDTSIPGCLNISKTVKLLAGNFETMQEVRIDLDKETLRRSLPLCLSVDLSLCVGLEESPKLLDASSTPRVLSVPCSSDIVDILHVLTVSQPLSNTNGCSMTLRKASSTGILDHSLDHLACSRPFSMNTDRSATEGQLQPGTSLESFSSKLWVDQKIVEAVTKQDKKDAEVQLLQMLLCDNPVLAQSCGDIAQIKAFTPQGTQISLRVLSSTRESGVRCTEVQLHTFHPADLSALMDALTHRLKRFGRSLEMGRNPPTVSTQSMRRYLREMEALSGEVEALRHSRKIHTQAEVIQKMSQLYSMLRNTTLNN